MPSPAPSPSPSPSMYQVFAVFSSTSPSQSLSSPSQTSLPSGRMSGRSSLQSPSAIE